MAKISEYRDIMISTSQALLVAMVVFSAGFLAGIMMSVVIRRLG